MTLEKEPYDAAEVTEYLEEIPEYHGYVDTAEEWMR